MKIIRKIATYVAFVTFIFILSVAVFITGMAIYTFAEALYPVVGWWNILIVIGIFMFLALLIIGIVELEKK